MSPDNSQAALPAPDPSALRHSERLRRRILDAIDAAGGAVAFSRFMEMALYEPGLGYYSAGAVKFGPGGDFVTAVDLGDFLARTIVATTAHELARLRHPVVVELGAGTGALAADLLRLLEASGIRDVEYRILEPSPDLRARQAELLRPFGARVGWIDELEPDSVAGLILANEVADALPVDRIVLSASGWQQLAVGREEHEFVWLPRPLPPGELALVESLVAELPEPLPRGFVTEIRPSLGPWTELLCTALSEGTVLVIDYGMTRREYFHPQRDTGTLMCHYRHRAHGDPFVYPGLQDITAWVDFTACARAATASGTVVGGYTTQGSWITEALLTQEPLLPELDAAAAAQLKTLLLPGEMGERFKVLMLNRSSGQNSRVRLPGRDLRGRL